MLPMTPEQKRVHERLQEELRDRIRTHWQPERVNQRGKIRSDKANSENGRKGREKSTYRR